MVGSKGTRIKQLNKTCSRLDNHGTTLERGIIDGTQITWSVNNPTPCDKNVIYNGLLTPEDVKFLEDPGVTVYDASGVGALS